MIDEPSEVKVSASFSGGFWVVPRECLSSKRIIENKYSVALSKYLFISSFIFFQLREQLSAIKTCFLILKWMFLFFSQFCVWSFLESTHNNNINTPQIQVRTFKHHQSQSARGGNQLPSKSAVKMSCYIQTTMTTIGCKKSCFSSSKIPWFNFFTAAIVSLVIWKVPKMEFAMSLPHKVRRKA